jgi:hypothetical protein
MSGDRQRALQSCERPRDAVDLRLPRVGDERDSHECRSSSETANPEAALRALGRPG